MFPEEKQEVVDELRLIMEYQKITKVSKNSQKKIIQRQIKMIKRCLKQYLKKDICLQKRDRKSLTI